MNSVKVDKIDTEEIGSLIRFLCGNKRIAENVRLAFLYA
jgi:hypothetical protein